MLVPVERHDSKFSMPIQDTRKENGIIAFRTLLCSVKYLLVYQFVAAGEGVTRKNKIILYDFLSIKNEIRKNGSRKHLAAVSITKECTWWLELL